MIRRPRTKTLLAWAAIPALAAAAWFGFARFQSARDASALRDASHARSSLGGASNLFRPTASTEFSRAARDPRRWRQLDRLYRFDGLLLDGNPALHRPLTDHLRQAGDWVLAGADHAALAYARAPRDPWKPEDLAPWREKISRWPAPRRAAALARLSARLLVAGAEAPAREAALEATRADPSSAEAWAQRAATEAAAGAWEEALEQAGRSLALKSNNGPALSVKAQASSHLGLHEAAYAASREWARQSPGDAQALFHHARMAHAVRAYGTEAETLRELIALSLADDAPVAGYRVFLGQALAKMGEGEAAAREFESALAEGGLAEREKAFVEEALGRVRPARP